MPSNFFFVFFFGGRGGGLFFFYSFFLFSFMCGEASCLEKAGKGGGANCVPPIEWCWYVLHTYYDTLEDM